MTHCFLVATLCLVSGCLVDPVAPEGIQLLRVGVKDRSTGENLKGAVVTVNVRTKGGLTPDVREELDNSLTLGQDSALTDESGNADVPIRFCFPSYKLVPDQITGEPIALRIEVGKKGEKKGEYLYGAKVQPGDVLHGSRFEVQVKSIGQTIPRK
jgi:hypothetical protein